MDESLFSIYLEPLREGREETLSERILPSFLEVSEHELSFEHPVDLSGKVYLADQEIIFHWNIQTQARVPCTICNEHQYIPIKLDNVYASASIEGIKNGIFNFKELLRETLLLEIPSFVECHNGCCPKRAEYGLYFKQLSEQEGANPFAAL